MLVCKLLGFRQFADLETLRLAQLDSLLHLEDSFATTVPNVNVYGPVLVAVKKESVAVSLENLRHASKLPRANRKDHRSVGTQFGLGLFPRDEGLIAVFDNSCLQVPQVFQVLDAFSQALDRLGQGLELFASRPYHS